MIRRRQLGGRLSQNVCFPKMFRRRQLFGRFSKNVFGGLGPKVGPGFQNGSKFGARAQKRAPGPKMIPEGPKMGPEFRQKVPKVL